MIDEVTLENSELAFAAYATLTTERIKGTDLLFKYFSWFDLFPIN